VALRLLLVVHHSISNLTVWSGRFRNRESPLPRAKLGECPFDLLDAQREKRVVAFRSENIGERLHELIVDGAAGFGKWDNRNYDRTVGLGLYGRVLSLQVAEPFTRPIDGLLQRHLFG
jgi:hypothetical protein